MEHLLKNDEDVSQYYEEKIPLLSIENCREILDNLRPHFYYLNAAFWPPDMQQKDLWSLKRLGRYEMPNIMCPEH